MRQKVAHFEAFFFSSEVGHAVMVGAEDRQVFEHVLAAFAEGFDVVDFAVRGFAVVFEEGVGATETGTAKAKKLAGGFDESFVAGVDFDEVLALFGWALKRFEDGEGFGFNFARKDGRA